MASVLSRGSISLTVQGTQTNTLDQGAVVYPFTHSASVTLTNGTGASQADKVFTDTRTLTASATEDIDLAAVLTDAFGATLTFAKVKAVIISAAAANTNDVQVTRPASNGVPLFMAASDGIALKPGYSFAFFGAGTGVTVTAGTGDLLTLTNSAGSTSVTYTIVVIGTSV